MSLRDVLQDEIISTIKLWTRELSNPEMISPEGLTGSILSLPEMQMLLDKAKKWDAWPEYILDAVRSRGWLHKDDPVEGLEVVDSCRELHDPFKYKDCPKCHGKGEVTRPLTVEEALTMFPSFFKAIYEGSPTVLLPIKKRVRVKRGTSGT